MKLLNKTLFPVFLSIFLFGVFTPLTVAEGAVMSDYCVTPPFLAQTIPPNVLIVLDNSLSMGCQAYAGSYDPAQFSSGNYYGYFDPTKNYKYNGSRWEETSDAMTTGTKANPVASGNLLNWATMRRVEVSKKLLIGGKSNPRSWNGSVTVKLEGESNLSYCDSFSKSLDNTSVPNLIFPFTGEYSYTRSSDELSVTFLGDNTEIRRPTSDLANGAWTPNSGSSRYTQVDEATADTSDYLTNKTSNSSDQVIFGYDKGDSFAISGTITEVTITVRAKRSGNNTMRIQGVLRVKNSASVDADSISDYSALSASWANYQFSWSTNPQTGVAWTWNDLTTSAMSSLTGFGVKAYTTPSSSLYPMVAQVYMTVTVNIPEGGPYKIIVDMGPGKDATGIIDSLTNDVKFGLAYYASSNNGAKINTYVDFGTPTNMITSIQNMTPETYTPLGESLYEMTRYFRQDAPYYSNSPADYQTGLNYDPYYYKYSSLDSSLADRYVPCAKSFILFLTDGESTMDQSIPGTSTSSPYAACSAANIKACSGYGGSPTNPNPRFAGTSIGKTYDLSGTDYLIDVAYWARTNDMRSGSCTTVPTTAQQCIPGTQNISLYDVYMFGTGSTLLKDAAIYGGFNDLDADNKPDCTTKPTECYKDSDGDGVVRSDGTDDPLTYYEGEDGYALYDAILAAISDILRRVTSGTAASVLASGEGSGANLVQATYYPKRQFGSDSVNWIGSLQNLWYYVDPFFNFSNIREEGGTSKDFILDLHADGTSNSRMDYVLQLYFDDTEQKTKAKRYYDEHGKGEPGAVVDTIDFESLGNLWNAGSLLWSRDITSDPRAIKTWLDKNSNGAVDSGEFIELSASAYTSLSASDKTLLKTALQAADDAAASRTIGYVNGYDKFCTDTGAACSQDSNCTSPATCSSSGYRTRTVAVDLNGDGDAADSGESAKVWKLGDIINSTPQTASWMQLNDYDTIYSDSKYEAFVNDTDSTLSVNSTARYKNKGMVFVGANDGMLHAFKLGKLGLQWASQTSTQKAVLGRYCSDSPSTACVSSSDCSSGSCATDGDLGKEIWAFVPKNGLPYLKYTHDPAYCHIYSIDLAPFVFDASIEGPTTTCTETNYWNCTKNSSSWRTVLIGGMRFGGGCKDTSYDGSAGVEVPVDGQGYSSYFALDITDPYNPQLLWEFSNSALGFATSGPAVARISARNTGASVSSVASDKNGRWFVILGSGPTGGIDTADHQFLGNSDQNLTLFVLDLKTGAVVRTIPTGIANAFAGSLIDATHDSDIDYQDDVIYIPYVRKCVAGDIAGGMCDSAQGRWNNGGVLRLLTNEDLDSNTLTSTALYPANWEWSTVIDDAGPVTSSVVKLQNFDTGELWVYFGTGRYFYKSSTTIDDADRVRHLYGLKDPCFSGGVFLASCLAGSGISYTASELEPVDLSTTEGVDDDQGWIITLDNCTASDGTAASCSSAYYRTERVITDPLSSQEGVVFFTTLKPFDDICTSGGITAVWAVKYDTGGSASGLLRGKALIQVSTGAIEQMDLSKAFTEKGNRKTTSMQGVPPTSRGLSVITSPPPEKKIIHIKER